MGDSPIQSAPANQAQLIDIPDVTSGRPLPPILSQSLPHKGSLGSQFAEQDDDDVPTLDFEGQKAPLLGGRQRVESEVSHDDGGDDGSLYGSIQTVGSRMTTHSDADERQASMFVPFQASIKSRASSTKSQLQDSMHSAGSRTSVRSDLLTTLVEKVSTDRGATLILAIWNILPLLQGSAVFSMPYSLAQGGFVIIAVIVILSIMADQTALILVDCLYEYSPRSKVRKRIYMDYVDLAKGVMGKHGHRLMNVMLNFYLFTGDVVNVILIAQSVYSLLHPYTNLSFAVLTIIFSVSCYPTLFITKLSVLAYLSMLSVISIIIGIVTVVVVFITEHQVWSTNLHKLPIYNEDGFPLAAGIVMFSCLTHSVLPNIEGNMDEPRKIKRAVHISFFSSCMLKILVAVLGALSYGVATQSLVTLDASTSGLVARIICATTLTAFGIFNYPLNMFICCLTMDGWVENTRLGRGGSFWYVWLSTTRLFLTALSVLVALIVPYFGILLAVRGSLIGTCLIFIFPCFFQLKLKMNKMNWYQIIRNVFLIVAGTGIGGVALYSSVYKLYLAIKAGK